MKAIFLLSLIFSLGACSIPAKPSRLASGKQLSFQRNKGNCLACHIIEDGKDPGNIGPALVNIQTRFTTKTELKTLIWDASQFNANTSMPPYGKNKILNPEELELVVDYIWSLKSLDRQPDKEWK